MDENTIKLVQQSWDKLSVLDPQAAAHFYQNLFAADPLLKSLFKGDMVEQGQKLIDMIGAAVGMLNELDKLNQILHDLAKRHVNYGVEAQHYETLGGVLIQTLGQGLGDEFTDEVKEAWVTIYGVITKQMLLAVDSRA